MKTLLLAMAVLLAVSRPARAEGVSFIKLLAERGDVECGGSSNRCKTVGEVNALGQLRANTILGLVGNPANAYTARTAKPGVEWLENGGEEAARQYYLIVYGKWVKVPTAGLDGAVAAPLIKDARADSFQLLGTTFVSPELMELIQAAKLKIYQGRFGGAALELERQLR